MLVAIWIFGVGQVKMVQQVILIVDPGDGANRSDDERVIEKIVQPLVLEQPAMQPVVSDDKQRVVAGADHWNRQENYPPNWIPRHEPPRAKDHSPAEERIEHGFGWTQRAKLLQFLGA